MGSYPSPGVIPGRSLGSSLLAQLAMVLGPPIGRGQRLASPFGEALRGSGLKSWLGGGDTDCSWLAGRLGDVFPHETVVGEQQVGGGASVAWLRFPHPSPSRPAGRSGRPTSWPTWPAGRPANGLGGRSAGPAGRLAGCPASWPAGLAVWPVVRLAGPASWSASPDGPTGEGMQAHNFAKRWRYRLTTTGLLHPH